jgi:hypothetical protein
VRESGGVPGVVKAGFAPAEDITVHATADLSRFAQREAGVGTTVS